MLLATPPVAGTLVTLQRRTIADTGDVAFSNGIPSGADLVRGFRKILYIAQESVDGLVNSLRLTASNVYDALNRRVANVADPVNSNDAANAGWVTKIVQSIPKGDKGDIGGIANAASSIAIAKIPQPYAIDGSDVPGLDIGGTGIRFRNLLGGPADGRGFAVQRDVAYVGGDPNFVNSSFSVLTNINTAGSEAIEWCGLFQMNNHSDHGQNVAMYALGQKYGQGETWGMVTDVIDWTGESNPTTGLVSHEFDVECTGGDANHCRIGLHVALRRPIGTTGAAAECYAAVRLDSSTDENALFYSGIITAGKFINGFDTRLGTFGGSAIRLATDHSIAFSEDEAHNLAFDGAALRYNNSTDTLFSVQDNGVVSIKGPLFLQNKQVVGAQQPGWAAPVGTVARTTLNTATATTADVAQHLAALIEDLTRHGLISA